MAGSRQFERAGVLSKGDQMSTGGLKRVMSNIVQNCWVVPHLEAAIRKWLDMGYGPFLTLELDIPDARYRGKTVPLSYSVALANGGGVQIELIQQRSNGASAYRDMYGPAEGGFHHVCIFTDDYDTETTELSQRGIVLATECMSFGVRSCYADTRGSLGCMLEVIQNVPLVQGLYRAVVDAAKDWDGSDPVRPFKL
jgi:Glyoxalase/Bleomycin resistance protein/Dioxygenase superfamily